MWMIAIYKGNTSTKIEAVEVEVCFIEAIALGTLRTRMRTGRAHVLSSNIGPCLFSAMASMNVTNQLAQKSVLVEA